MIENLGLGERLVFFLGICLYALRNFPFYITATVIAVIVADCFRRLWNGHHYWSKQGIHGPEQHWLLGNTLQLKAGIEKFDLENYAKYGKTFGSNIFGIQQLITADLDLIREFTVKQFSHCINRRPIGAPGIYDNDNCAFAHGILSLRDQRWKDVRTTVTPAFTTGKLKNMLPLFNECMVILCKKLDEIADNKEQFDAKTLFGAMTIDVIAKSAFGVDVDAQNDRDCLFYKYAREIFDFRFGDPKMLAIAMFPNVCRVLQDIMKKQFVQDHINRFFIDSTKKIVEERLKVPRTTNLDFLQLLLNTIYLNDQPVDDQPDETIAHPGVLGRRVAISEMELVGQTALFIAAGFETTATTLQFIAYMLAMHPEIQEKCHREVEIALRNKKSVDLADLAKMPFCEQVMNETLRMFPPAPRLSREVNKELIFNDIHLHPGDEISANIFAIHRNPEYYPEPERFDPDRFTSEAKSQRDPLTFLAFGCGPRNCIGMRFAQLEIRLALAHLMAKFRFLPNDRTSKMPLKLDTAGLMRAAEPVYLSVEKR